MEDQRRAAKPEAGKELHRKFSNSDSMHTNKVLENLPCYDTRSDFDDVGKSNVDSRLELSDLRGRSCPEPRGAG